MKRFRWAMATMLTVLVVLAPMALAVDAGDEQDRKAKKREKKPKVKKIGGYYGIMAKILKLTPEQTEKAAAAGKARQKAKSDWDKSEKGQKLAALKKEMAALIADRKKADAEAKAVFDGVLAKIISPEQLATWKGYEVGVSMMRRFKRVGLSDEQVAKVRQLCAAVGKELTGADGVARKAIVDKLSARIAADVLDDAQRGKLPKPRGKKPAKVAKAPKDAKG